MAATRRRRRSTRRPVRRRRRASTRRRRNPVRRRRRTTARRRPARRRTTRKRATRRRNPRRRRTTRKRATRRRSPRRRRRRTSRRRRNAGLFGGMFGGGIVGKALWVTGGAVGTHVVGNVIANSIPGVQGTAWGKPVTKLAGAWAVSWLAGKFVTTKGNAQLMFLGGVASVLLDVYNDMIRPSLPAMFQGYGDYVQMPYSGYGTPAQVAAGEFGDYVQMPYSGYGTPAQVAAGEFGHYNAGEMATFGPTF